MVDPQERVKAFEYHNVVRQRVQLFLQLGLQFSVLEKCLFVSRDKGQFILLREL